MLVSNNSPIIKERILFFINKEMLIKHFKIIIINKVFVYLTYEQNKNNFVNKKNVFNMNFIFRKRVILSVF